MRRRLLPLLVAAVLGTTGLSACSKVGDGGYHLTAWFSRAVALYAQSKVKVMGVDVGRVTKVAIVGDRIRVDMLIDEKIPLPADVHASIVPLSLIGERNVVLSPAWTPGKDKAKDRDTIDLDRTTVPVEPDEALSALTNLAHAINPEDVRKLVANGAGAVRGQGQQFNDALSQAAQLTNLLASQDQALLDVVNNVHQLADTLNQRQQQLGKLLDDFSQATGILADERESLKAFLTAIASLVAAGNALVTRYQEQLPGDIADLTQVVLTVRVNSQSVVDLLRSLDDTSHVLVTAYDPQIKGLIVRITMTPTAVKALQPFFDLLGLGTVPCVPLLGLACP